MSDASQIGIVNLTRLDMRTLNTLGKVADESGVVDLVQQWRLDDGYDPARGGRKAQIPLRTVLILMSMLAVQGKRMLIKDAVTEFCDHPDNGALRHLGLPNRTHEDYTTRFGRNAVYMCFYRQWARIRKTMELDPDLSYRKRILSCHDSC